MVIQLFLSAIVSVGQRKDKQYVEKGLSPSLVEHIRENIKENLCGCCLAMSPAILRNLIFVSFELLHVLHQFVPQFFAAVFYLLKALLYSFLLIP